MKHTSITILLFSLVASTALAEAEADHAHTGAEFALMTAMDLELAEPAWNRHCAKCHGKNGNGPASRLGSRLGLSINYAEPGSLDGFTDERLDEITADGMDDSKMKGFSSRLSAEEITALTRYMRSFSKP